MAQPVIDVFAGPGGLSLGLSCAGFEIAAAVEIDPNAARTFAKLHPNAEIFDDDIRKVDFKRFRGRAAIVVAGVPCQPFSNGGKRLAAHDPRDGFPQLLRVLDEARPYAVVIENVAGLTQGPRRSYFESILTRLRELRYRPNWQVINAADHGVPQKRQRAFIVAIRGRIFEFPAKTHGESTGRPWVSSGSVLSPERILGEANPSVVMYAKNPDLRPSPYDGHLFNGGGRPVDLSAPAHTILASAGGNKTHFVDVLGVVPEYHAQLMTGGRPRSGVVTGARRITVEESARLQTFPPDAHFEGSRSSQYEQVGNAVPPILAERIGRALMAQLA